MNIIVKDDSKIELVKNFKKYFEDTKVLALDKDYVSLIYYKKSFPKSIIFNNAVEAMIVAKLNKFDLFLIEVFEFPFETIDVLNEIRKTKLNEKTPILLLTQYASCDEKTLNLFDGYMFKPVPLLDLYSKSKELIEKSQSF